MNQSNPIKFPLKQICPHCISPPILSASIARRAPQGFSPALKYELGYCSNYCNEGTATQTGFF
jgi:hypothetical protein